MRLRPWFWPTGCVFACLAGVVLVLAGCGGTGPRLTDTGGGGGASPPPPAVLVSANDQGQAANAPVYATGMSPDARYVAFASAASNLPGATATGNGEVYLRDTCYSPLPVRCTPVTTMISVTPSGAPGNSPAATVFALGMGTAGAAVSLGGRYVAFASMATDLTAGLPASAAAPRIFLRDTCQGAPAGCQPATTLVSADANGAPVLTTGAVAMGADGRYVADVEGLAAGQRNIVLHDTCAGAAAGCVPSSRAITTGGMVSPFGGIGLSGDGSVVVYQSDLSGAPAVYAATTCAGAAAGCAPVIADLSGSIGPPTAGALALPLMYPAISADGQRAAFWGGAGQAGGGGAIYMAPICAGAESGCEPAPVLLPQGAGVGAMPGEISLGTAGRYIAYGGEPLGVNPPMAETSEIYASDTCLRVTSGCTPATREVSLNPRGGPASGASNDPSLSEDGREVIFMTSSPDLGATGGTAEVVMMPTGLVNFAPAD